jgi:hypothetical protein
VARVLLVAALPVGAVGQENKPDLSNLKDVIQSMKWKALDVAALSPLERCRALLLLNDSLDEIGASTTAEADLMSQYIEKEKLGPEFAKCPPPMDPAPLTYDDCVKIAVTMLRGPLAQSSYATELADTGPDGQRAYEHLYQATCQRKWSQVVETRRQVLCMANFVKAKGKTQDYKAWVPGALKQQEQEFDKLMASRREAYVAKEKAEEKAAEQRAAEMQKQRQQAAQQKQKDSIQMMQAMAAAQQSQSQQTSNDDDDGWFPGWWYGYTDPHRMYQDAGYRGQASAATDQRLSGWHGAGGGGGRR